MNPSITFLFVVLMSFGELESAKHKIDMLVICDNYCYQKLGAMKDKEGFIRGIVSGASKILSRIDVSLSISRLEIWDKIGFSDWVTPSHKYKKMLSYVAKLRSQRRFKSQLKHYEDVIFYTGIPMTAGNTMAAPNVAGVHTTGSIGASASKGILNIPSRPNKVKLSVVTAHEVGHGLNMRHDTSSCSCPTGAKSCVMYPATTSSMLKNPTFSKCSKDKYYPWIKANAKRIDQTDPLPSKFCGNGKVDSGEDCDCAPKQCSCCDVNTCKYRSKNTQCYGSCKVCSGKSKDCTKKNINSKTDHKQCSGNNDNMCYKGSCVSVKSQCTKRYYPWAKIAAFSNFKNKGKKSKTRNSGGFYALDASNKKKIAEEFRSVGDEGHCSLLQCAVSSSSTTAKDWDSNKTPREVFVVEKISAGYVKVKYYNTETKTVKGKKAKIYHPLLVDDGTPCRKGGRMGYCKKHKSRSSKYGVDYYYSKCHSV